MLCDSRKIHAPPPTLPLDNCPQTTRQLPHGKFLHPPPTNPTLTRKGKGLRGNCSGGADWAFVCCPMGAIAWGRQLS